MTQMAIGEDELEALRTRSKQVRRRIVEGLWAAGGGHYGGALSVADILVTIYARASACRALAAKRDMILLSKGHGAIAFYALLEMAGELPQGCVDRYATFGAGVEGHPDVTVTPQVGFSTGSLGQGLSVAAGIALALGETAGRVWVVLGDGECQEGQIWEAAQFAARYRLSGITVVIDHNSAQEFGYGYRPDLEQLPLPGMAGIWQAFGWNVQEIDGHDHADLSRALIASTVSDRPTAVIAHTCKGMGVPRFASEPERYHCTTLNEAEHRLALRSIEQ